MFRRAVATAVLFAAFVAAPLHAQTPVAGLFRIFLLDGRALTTYGEWARLEDRVVFSMPTRGIEPQADLHLVSVPSIEVDWARTDRYATSVRGGAYAATRGEADFARLSDEVARTLNLVAATKAPADRLRIAEGARRALTSWPGAQYNYRAEEVREILGILDEVIAELRAAAGGTRFDLSLVSPTPAAAAEPLLPVPTAAELVEQLVTASSLAETPAERLSLLQTVLGVLDRTMNLLPRAWADRVRRAALGSMADEQRVNRAYAELRSSTMTASNRFTRLGDVRGLEKLRRTVTTRDARLGHQRHAEMAALVSTLDAQLDPARARRLALDQWQLRAPGLRRYRRAIDDSLQAFTRLSPQLGDVRGLAGPLPAVLVPTIDRMRRDGARLAGVLPPAELVAVHALLRSAWTMAESAFTLRLSAARANDVTVAQQASSAAAGALMLLSKARADLDLALASPASQP